MQMRAASRRRRSWAVRRWRAIGRRMAGSRPVAADPQPLREHAGGAAQYAFWSVNQRPRRAGRGARRKATASRGISECARGYLPYRERDAGEVVNRHPLERAARDPRDGNRACQLMYLTPELMFEREGHSRARSADRSPGMGAGSRRSIHHGENRRVCAMASAKVNTAASVTPGPYQPPVPRAESRVRLSPYVRLPLDSICCRCHRRRAGAPHRSDSSKSQACELASADTTES